MVQQLAQQRDPVLDAFHRLRVQEVEMEVEDTASTFLAKFRSTAAKLEPDERIKLEMTYMGKDTELLKAALADPQADKICSLRWEYEGEEDVNSVIPLLLSNCPELALLWVEFKRNSTLDFASSVLEHPSNKVKVLHVSYTGGDIPRFFAALEQSQVSAFTISGDGSPEFAHGLYEYLANDLLVRLEVGINHKVPSEMTMSLAKCTRLAELGMWQCEFSQPTALIHLPKSVTKLVFYSCTFAGGFDWSFLADSHVRDLGFFGLLRVDASQLGSALAVYLGAKGLDELRLWGCVDVDEILAAVGAEIGRVKRLILENSYIDDDSTALIALALQSPNNKLRELRLPYEDSTMSSIENYLVPALKQPNCCLDKLSFWVDEEYEAAAKALEDGFHHRRALFALLQGQQVRRKAPCLLRRLPVEMFRLVGGVLL